LGVTLKPPPEAAAPLAASLHPSLNTRERVALQTKGGACMTCHGTINSLGFTLERFDAVGRLREKDNAKLIDSNGWYIARDGKKVTLENAATYRGDEGMFDDEASWKIIENVRASCPTFPKEYLAEMFSPVLNM
jgi:hypothetical protein